MGVRNRLQGMIIAKITKNEAEEDRTKIIGQPDTTEWGKLSKRAGGKRCIFARA